MGAKGTGVETGTHLVSAISRAMNVAELAASAFRDWDSPSEPLDLADVQQDHAEGEQVERPAEGYGDGQQ